MPFNTCDLYDVFGEEAGVPDVPLEDFGGRARFTGEIFSIKCFEDNSRVKEASLRDGRGKVLVVDGGGSRRYALMGDMIALDAAKNGWQGVIIFGCVRDRLALRTIDLGIKALGTTPRKSERRGEGQTGLPLQFGGMIWRPGDIVFADPDGVIVLTPKQVAEVG